MLNHCCEQKCHLFQWKQEMAWGEQDHQHMDTSTKTFLKKNKRGNKEDRAELFDLPHRKITKQTFQEEHMALCVCA